jgi:hypothetical protein
VTPLTWRMDSSSAQIIENIGFSPGIALGLPPPQEETMTKFLAGVLSVIAVGVLLIAYGLLGPRASAFGEEARFARPMLANQQMFADPNAAYLTYGSPASGFVSGAQPVVTWVPASAPAYQPAPVYAEARPVRTVVTQPAPRATRVVERAPQRNWKKTALVIGGSTATGAGVGAIFGGKKGALIGAAIGGGASTIYESTK